MIPNERVPLVCKVRGCQDKECPDRGCLDRGCPDKGCHPACKQENSKKTRKHFGKKKQPIQNVLTIQWIERNQDCNLLNDMCVSERDGSGGEKPLLTMGTW